MQLFIANIMRTLRRYTVSTPMLSIVQGTSILLAAGMISVGAASVHISVNCASGEATWASGQAGGEASWARRQGRHMGEVRRLPGLPFPTWSWHRDEASGATADPWRHATQAQQTPEGWRSRCP
eukprot:1157637-Pelagomonas_calceolata.AAC.3